VGPFSARSRGATALWRRRPLRPWARAIALGLPLVVVSTSVGVPAASADVKTQAKAASSCPSSAADEAAALISARLCGGAVPIANATSETTTSVALASGQVQSTISAGPVRVKQDGKWVPVDLTLVTNADGSISPRAASSDLVISGPQPDAGEHALAAVGTGSDRVAVNWAGKLGTPELAGDQVTYREVLPGVDLVVEATRKGAETFFVVKNRAAAAQVAELSLPVTGTQVASYRSDADGNVTLLDENKRTVATAPAPQMWDAKTDARTGEPVNIRKVAAKFAKRAARLAKPKKPTDGAGASVTLTPDQSILTDPATQYPVTIDPQINPVAATFDTYVKQGDTVDRSGANDLEAGIVNGSVTRSFVHWDTTALRGKQITAAAVNLWNWWSPSCTPAAWTIWSTGAASTDTRWTNQPSWNYREAVYNGTKGFDSTCDDGWVGINAQSFFQRAADNQQSRAYMGIRADVETDGNSFKQFRSINAASSSQVPYAVVTYNSYPVVQSVTTTPTSTCATGTGRPYVNSATPTLKATLTDAEGGSVKGVFEWYNAAGTKLGTTTTATAASGSTVSATVPASVMTDGNWYSWRVQANDGTVGGTWSNSCEFQVDTTAPTVTPTVLSSTYPRGQRWRRGLVPVRAGHQPAHRGRQRDHARRQRQRHDHPGHQRRTHPLRAVTRPSREPVANQQLPVHSQQRHRHHGLAEDRRPERRQGSAVELRRLHLHRRDLPVAARRNRHLDHHPGRRRHRRRRRIRGDLAPGHHR